MRKVVVILLAMGFIQKFAFATDTILIKHSVDFEVTGDGTNMAWNATAWIPIPQRNHPDQEKSTRFKTLYSDKGIYFLFSCEDQQLTATMQHDFDHLWEEDVVEVFLWPDTLHITYFEYEISPLNKELPILIPNINGEFLGWAPWDYFGERKVKHLTITEPAEANSGADISHWQAEFFIPFDLLRPLANVPPKPGQIWRGNFYRLDYDKRDPPFRWTWTKVGRSFHDYENFGYLLFE